MVKEIFLTPMLDRKKIDSFWSKREKIKDPRISTHFKKDDTHVYDLKLIRKYIKKTSHVLDLACGTCYISNELAGEVAYIKAIDKFGKFLTYCKTSPDFETQEVDLIGYKDDRLYDVILGFGIMNYFDDKEALAIYKNMSSLLNKKGTFIVKHQSGIGGDVMVDNYSQQIGDTYHALYRHIEKDKRLLEKYFDVTIVDVYPKKLNPWPDTHFYAFICTKR